MTRAPTLETPRLVLRAHRKDDYPAIAAMWAEPKVGQFILGRLSTAEESWARLLRYAGHWSLMGFGFWAAQEKSSGAFIGEMGFGEFHRDIDPPFGDRPEAGWALASRCHGQGYASEAMSAIMAWGDRQFGKRESVCMISPENLASIRLAQKFNFREAHQATYKGDKVTVYYRSPA